MEMVRTDVCRHQVSFTIRSNGINYHLLAALTGESFTIILPGYELDISCVRKRAMSHTNNKLNAKMDYCSRWS